MVNHIPLLVVLGLFLLFGDKAVAQPSNTSAVTAPTSSNITGNQSLPMVASSISMPLASVTTTISTTTTTTTSVPSDDTSIACDELAVMMLPGYANPIKLPPPGNVTMIVTLFIQSFMGVDTLSQTVKTSVLIRFKWIDNRLGSLYQNSTCEVEPMPVPLASALWYPKFSIPNTADTLAPGDLDNTPVMIFKSGYVVYTYETDLSVTCNMDLSRFPFEWNICYYHIVPTRDMMDAPVVYNTTDWTQIKYGTQARSLLIDMANSSLLKINDNSLINPLFTMGRTCTIVGDSKTFLFAHAYFMFEVYRIPYYYWPVVFVPTGLVSILMSVVFISKANDEEKLSIALTVLLSYFVLSYSLADQLPSTSTSIPWIYYFYAYQTALSAFATIIATLIRNKAKQEEAEYYEDETDNNSRSLYIGTESKKKRSCRCKASTLNKVALVLYCLLCAAGYGWYFAEVYMNDNRTETATISVEGTKYCNLTEMHTAREFMYSNLGLSVPVTTSGSSSTSSSSTSSSSSTNTRSGDSNTSGSTSNGATNQGSANSNGNTGSNNVANTAGTSQGSSIGKK